jgi:dihydropteroate synthase
MGVVNVTPDSFSDGGAWFEPAAAIDHGLRLVADGADLVDVGGESTRPGADRPSIDEELRRVLPVVRELAAADVIVSVDTMRASVAEQALAAGARLVNDVSGGLADPHMFSVVASAEVPMVLMHWRGHAATMQERGSYVDVVEDVVAELHSRIEAALSAGIRVENIIIDPGLGFAKSWDHNWALLGQTHRFVEMNYPVLVAASRKTFLGVLLADPRTGRWRPPIDRDAATDALSMTLALDRVWCVRVHTIRATLDAVTVAARLGIERPPQD